MLEIRSMTERDLEAVAELEKEIFSMPWSIQGFAESINQNHTLYLVAMVDGKLAGYCGLMQILEEADITNVAVAVPYRRQQVGKRMLEELICQAERRGVCKMTLEVRKSNGAARSLYQKLGFEEEGIRKNYYEKPTEDAVIMWRRR